MAVDEAKLEELVGKFAVDFGAAMHAATVIVGDKLGLYRALAENGPTTADDLARATGFDARLVEEWLNAQYVSGYCEHDGVAKRFWLTEEQAAVLADDTGATFLAGAMTLAGATIKDEERIRDAFATGEGFGWHEHCHDLFHGTERLFKPGYVANLVTSWLPSLDGVEAKLEAGGTVADVGCGYGSSTILLARRFPAATITGFDYHELSIEMARKRAAEAGVVDRVNFEVASAHDFPGQGYDLVCIFDALHDMGDPPSAARHIRQVLADDGSWLLVEPMAGDGLEDNINPVGRIFYSGAVAICVPAAQAQPGGYCLGNQVPDSIWRELLKAAGFSRFRRATETPFNRIFEVRP